MAILGIWYVGNISKVWVGADIYKILEAMSFPMDWHDLTVYTYMYTAHY